MMTGRLRLCITAPDPVNVLKHLNDQQIRLRDAAIRDEFELYMTISGGDLPAVSEIARKLGCRLEVTEHIGFFWQLKALLGRRVLVAGVLLFLIWSAWIPSRILFFEVEGNQKVPSRLILEEAEKNGLSFGCSRRRIRSEPLKNQLLEAIPQLQWAGINTRGCVATVTVRERTDEQKEPAGPMISHIVSERDGIVQQVLTRRGTALCQSGQAVRRGDILISGFTDCGQVIHAQRAEGEVFAQTSREISVKIPTKMKKKLEHSDVKTRFALQIGKNRINFYKESGNLPHSCDKIVSRYRMTLPGGFALPVEWIVEELRPFRTEEWLLPRQSVLAQLQQDLRREINRRMIAGQILSEDLDFYDEAGCYILEGTCTCTEMIGREQTEEFLN